jgi:ketosteroid isomerase-like protein
MQIAFDRQRDTTQGSYRKRGDMAEHPNVGRIRKGFEALETVPRTEADMAFVDQLFADDVVWTKQGGSKLAGVERGKTAVFAALAAVDTESDNTFARDIKQVYADDEHAVCLMQIHAGHAAHRLDWGEVAVFTFNDVGQVKDFWGITEDLQKVDEFWAGK